MPLLDLVCMGCWEVVFGATELGFEDVVGKEILVVSGGRVGSGVRIVSGVMVVFGLGNNGGSMDGQIGEVLSELVTEISVGDIGGCNNGWVGLLDKGNEISLSKDAETETWF